MKNSPPFHWIMKAVELIKLDQSFLALPCKEIFTAAGIKNVQHLLFSRRCFPSAFFSVYSVQCTTSSRYFLRRGAQHWVLVSRQLNGVDCRLWWWNGTVWWRIVFASCFWIQTAASCLSWCCCNPHGWLVGCTVWACTYDWVGWGGQDSWTSQTREWYFSMGRPHEHLWGASSAKAPWQPGL